jgi:hypothetical protein
MHNVLYLAAVIVPYFIAQIIFISGTSREVRQLAIF